MRLAGKLLLLAIASAGLMGYARAQPLPGPAAGAGVAVPAAIPGAGDPPAAGPEARGPAIGESSRAGAGFPAGPVARAAAAQAPSAGGTDTDLLFPVEAMPEPDGWTLLLCSLVAVGFIARRRSRRVSG
jgi:hypothetical protein